MLHSIFFQGSWLMPILKKFFDRVVHPSKHRQRVTTNDDAKCMLGHREMPGLAAQLGYQKLEPRQVLSASFTFGAGLLTLDGFDAGQNLTFSEDAGNDVFLFEIGSGAWGGDDSDPDITVTGTTLEVGRGLLTAGVTINGESTIGISQSGGFSISNFSISNFSLNDQSIDLNIDGNLQAGGLTVNDTLPADGIDVSILLTATGTIDVTGNLAAFGGNLLSVISISATGTTSDINVDAAAITTDAGSISLAAADAVTLSNSASVQAGLIGSVSLIANSDDATDAGATESIVISDGSTVSSTLGNISLSAIGADGGDITLGRVSTTGNVSISATGDVIDGTAAEIANVVGARADITAASIGALDDIDIQVQNLSFNSTGVVNITDLANGLIVDATSSAGSGSLIANSPLTISADVNLAGSFVFTAGDSAVVGDHLTVNNNAVITLTAATNETLDFIAGDDLIFDTGSIVTTGGGTHTVNLLADNEGAIDADRGSVTNTAGAVTTVTTNNLVVTAAAGVGAVGNGLRTAVDSLTVTNTLIGGVFVCETDGVVLVGISNINRDIAIAAGGFINMTGAINAGTGDVRLVAGGDVVQTAAGIITANELGVRQIATVFAAGNDLNANGRFDIVLDANNDVDVLAAANLFDGGMIAMNDIDDLTIGAMTAVAICSDASFAATTGVTTTYTGAVATGAGDVDDGDILLSAGGFLRLNQTVNAGAGSSDVRLVADGLISQAVAGVIIANELGVRQEGIGNVELCQANNVDVAAIFNNEGDIHFQNVGDYLIGNVSAQTIGGVSFAATTAFLTNSGNISFFSAGSFELTGNVTATTVRIIASGDITQTAGSVITAENLGVRQEGLSLGLDILLGEANDVDVLAAINLSDEGVIVFNDIDDLTVGSVAAFAFCGHLFAATTGVTTVNANITVNSGEDVTLQNAVTTAGGNVLIDAVGGVSSLLAGVINTRGTALNENSGFVDINAGGTVNLAGNVRTDGFGGTSNGGLVTIDTVNGSITVAAIDASGAVLGDGASILLNADGVNSDVIVTGQLTTTSPGVVTITADDSVTISGTGSIRVFGTGNVSVTSNTAATNGDSNDGITMAVASFIQTDSGTITLTSTGANGGDIVAQTLTTANANITVNSGGFLQLNETVSAGAGSADVRLVANGLISQAAAGVIIAKELGVRQEGVADGLDVLLGEANDVDVLAAINLSEGGVIVFRDVDDLTVATVSAQTIDGVTFAATTGVTTTFTGPVDEGAGDVSDGDVLLSAGGFLQLNESISAGAGLADVRLVANGDIHQAATAAILANELGVRQVATLFAAGDDLPVANARFDVILDGVNDVDRLAISNAFDGGLIAFRDEDNLTVAAVSAQTIGGVSFAATTGVTTTFTGAVVEGAGDVSDGDILLRAGGFLQLEETISASAGRADVRLVANGDIHQTATAAILANELGVRQEAAVFTADNDLPVANSRFDVILDGVNNDVSHLSMLNLDVAGDLYFVNSSALTINQVSGQTIAGITYLATNGVVSDDAGTISIVARGLLNDGSGVTIITNGDARFETDGTGSKILLANEVTDQLTVGGNATFQSQDSEIGQDSVAAGNGTVLLLGTVTILDDNDLSTLGTNTADITADSTITLAGSSAADILVLTSSGNITNAANAQTLVNEVQFNAVGNVYIGNQANDLFQHSTGANGEIQLGVVAANASIAVDSSLELNGSVPVAAVDVNRPHDVVTNEFDLGTAVTGTLFATSTGHIEQSIGTLNAVHLGLNAVEHVHLDRVSGLNQTIAIQAGDSNVANTQQVILDALAAVPKSEVNSLLDQSVSVVHLGSMTVGQVNNPDASPLAAADLVGVITNGIQDGSILLVATNSMAINENVSATSNTILPQVTTYVTDGLANDPSKITFGGGSLRVSGISGGETNQGVVNNSQTTAFFGIDTNADGVIDLVLPGTTEVVRLSGGGAAEQLIRGQYGSPGEVGYRLAFVWDSQRRFDPGFVAPHEVPNLYTSNATAATEFFDVTISNQDVVFVSTDIAAGDFTRQTSLIESQFPDGGVFNFNTLFAKQAPFTQNALFVRLDDIRIFTTIEVRNDQDINLFVGPLAFLDNSLNSATFVLEATLESFGLQAMLPNQVFFINTVLPEPEIVEPPRQIPFIPVFEEKEFRRLDDPGTLSYVAVRIGVLDDDEDNDPAEFIIEIDGELILKDPTADYQPLEEDAKPEKLDANQNEIAAIIAQIEADPNAEAGLWYKIFIDYEDGSGKKDKVLFYHFKTGERPSEELGPRSDFDSGAEANAETDSSLPNVKDELERNGNAPPNSKLSPPTDADESVLPADIDNQTGAFIPSHRPCIETAADSLATTSRMGLSAGTLLLVSMAANRKQQSAKQQSGNQPSLDHSPSSFKQTDFPVQAEWSFSRFDRLKRRVAVLMGRE